MELFGSLWKPFQGSAVNNAEPNITELLIAVGNGDENARDALYECVYQDLLNIAKGKMRYERRDHTLQATAIVNEVYLKISSGLALVSVKDRQHFFAMAAKIMRQLLMDHAEKRGAKKRVDGLRRVPLDDALENFEKQHRVTFVEFDDALNKLTDIDERQARIAELKLITGLKNKEIAEQLDTSESTVEKDWRAARAWLHQQLGP